MRPPLRPLGPLFAATKQKERLALYPYTRKCSVALLLSDLSSMGAVCGCCMVASARYQLRWIPACRSQHEVLQQAKAKSQGQELIF